MEFSLGELAPTKDKKNSYKLRFTKLSAQPVLTVCYFCSHIYQPVVNSLVYVAKHLESKEESQKLMLKSLQLFVQQGIEAKKASDKADASHKVSEPELCI